ncbi:MAG TPA: hypothetical protein VI094_12235 [Propionibacteriaceae bacterium]
MLVNGRRFPIRTIGSRGALPALYGWYRSSEDMPHHVQDIYVKLGDATRAAAAMFAMPHGLLDQSR